MTRITVLLSMLCVFAVSAISEANPNQAKPDFALRDVDGAARRLSDYRGKWVVLEWVNFDCAPVSDLYAAPRRSMQALQRAAMAQGVVWLQINSSAAGKHGYRTPTQAKAKLTSLGATPTASLLDAAGTVGKAFGVRVTPEARVVTPRGDVAYAGAVEHLHTVLNAATTGRAIPFASKPAKGCAIPYAATSTTTGPKAPDFALVDSGGVTRRLSDFRGKWVILEWVNYDCPFVKKQYHFSHKTMQKLQARSAQHGMVWLSICSSSPGSEGALSSAQANARIKQMGATPSAYLHDPTGTVGRAYGAKKTPDMRIIGPQGTIEYAGGIDSIPSMSVRDIPRAKKYVALAIGDIAAGRPIAIKKSKPYGCSVKY